MVPDALSRDAVPKPLCQRCYCLLSIEVIEEQDEVRSLERVASLVEGSWNGAGILGGGPTEEELRSAQVGEYGDVEEFAAGRKDYLVDDVGILRSTKREELPIIIPDCMKNEVLSFVHGSRTTGHYRLQRTLARLVRRFWWKGMGRDVALFIRNCIPCTVAEDRQPKRQVALEVVHPVRRFEQVGFDVQTITPRTSRGNIKVLAMVDIFTRYVRARAIPDEKAETIAQVLLEEWIGVFGPMEWLLSDEGPNMVGKVM